MIIKTCREVAINTQPIMVGIAAILIIFSLPTVSMSKPAVKALTGFMITITLAKIKKKN